MTEYPFLEITLGPDADVELACALLHGAGASGTETRDTDTMNLSSGEGLVTVVAYFPTTELAQGARDDLKARLPALALVSARLGSEQDPGWKESWKDYFQPTAMGERLWVALPDAGGDVIPEGATVVRILPSGAFGTGAHETTAMVLESLEGLVKPGCRVLDVGCGSGILAIAAILLGAEHARGVDVDPEAVTAALENGERNGVSAKTRFDATALEDIDSKYDLVLANLSAPVLCDLKEALAARVADGGHLVWSGLLNSDLDEVGSPPQLTMTKELRRLDWVAQIFSR